VIRTAAEMYAFLIAVCINLWLWLH